MADTTSTNNYAQDTFEFDFKDVDEVEEHLHSQCIEAHTGKCTHMTLEVLTRLANSNTIGGLMAVWAMQQLKLRLGGAGPSELRVNLQGGFATAFYQGAVYARNLIQKKELERMMKGDDTR